MASLQKNIAVAFLESVGRFSGRCATSVAPQLSRVAAASVAPGAGEVGRVPATGPDGSVAHAISGGGGGALQYPTHSRTYEQLVADAMGIGNGLVSRYNLARGDRVALFMTNVRHCIPTMLGCWLQGLVPVPVNAKLAAPELAHIVGAASAQVVVASPGEQGAVASAAVCTATKAGVASSVVVADDEDLEWADLVLDGSDATLADRSPGLALDTDDPAWIFYTSGTTGRPKGAVLSHRNVLSMAGQYVECVDEIRPGDSILHAAPLSHGSGFYAIPHLLGGACNVVPASAGFDADEVLAALAVAPRCSMFLAPTMVMRVVAAVERRSGDAGDDHTGLQAALENLKTIVYGGGPMYQEDVSHAMRVLGDRLVQIYGQGESPMTITVLDKAAHADREHPLYLQRLASVGVAQSHTRVCVVDAETKEEVPANTPGEVVVSGDTIMLEYLDDAEATAETVKVATHCGVSGRWLHTGDIGFMTDDGYLTLVDRIKDVIVSGGSNIYPREVEEVLLRHEAVSSCAIVGRRHPEWGEEVVAFVVADVDEDVREKLETELDALCLKHLARFKRPKEYIFMDDPPTSAVGKVLKTQLRDRLHASSQSNALTL